MLQSWPTGIRVTWWKMSAWLMEPQLAFLAGEKKLRARMRERQRRMETAAKRGEMKNIIEEVPRSPTREVCQEKYLNTGLKFGAEARSRPRQARLTLA